LKGHISVEKTCAWNEILYIMAAPILKKRETGGLGNFPVVFLPKVGKEGEVVVSLGRNLNGNRATRNGKH
jgi:hypothetical protein